MKGWALWTGLLAVFAIGVLQVPFIAAPAVCGNGIIENEATGGNGEQCDGAAWGPITSCTALGYPNTAWNNDPAHLSCILASNPDVTKRCLFDLSQCQSAAPTCGNGAVEAPVEICDPSAAPPGCPGGQTCLPDCSACAATPGICGNGVIDPGEDCDFNTQWRQPTGPGGDWVPVFRPGIRCSAFGPTAAGSAWIRELLDCRTTNCRARPRFCDTQATTTSVAMKCAQLSIVDPETPWAYRLKTDYLAPGNPGYDPAGPDLVACNPAALSRMCTATQCVYANEADQATAPGGVGGGPLCVRAYTPSWRSYLLNAHNHTISCSAQTIWCPAGLKYVPGPADTPPGPGVHDPGTTYPPAFPPTGPLVGACVNRLCGDGVLDAGEQCDGAAWGSVTGCADLGYVGGGPLACGAPTDPIPARRCLFDVSTCLDEAGQPGSAFSPSTCGNGALDAGEDCEWNRALVQYARVSPGQVGFQVETLQFFRLLLEKGKRVMRGLRQRKECCVPKRGGRYLWQEYAAGLVTGGPSER